MRKIQLFKLKFVIYLTVGIVIVNSYMWFQLSQGFFDFSSRIFLFLMFNQMFLGFGLMFIYFFAKFKAMEDDFEQMKYLIKRISKRKK